VKSLSPRNGRRRYVLRCTTTGTTPREDVKAYDPTVFVVDDDAAFRQMARRVVSGQGIRVRDYASCEEFLEACSGDSPGCVVLEFDLAGLSGLEVQAQLLKRHVAMPVVFVARRAGVSDVSRALLLERVREAITFDRGQRARSAATQNARRAIRSLSDRERQVADLVIVGLGNKQIAQRLGITERTVEFHRSNIMQKLEARSAAELIRLWLTHARLV
jgi:two-component system response regulator FixJ